MRVRDRGIAFLDESGELASVANWTSGIEGPNKRHQPQFATISRAICNASSEEREWLEYNGTYSSYRQYCPSCKDFYMWNHVQWPSPLQEIPAYDKRGRLPLRHRTTFPMYASPHRSCLGLGGQEILA